REGPMPLSWDRKGALLVALACSLALFFGLLFGLMYPEIRVAGYAPTTCTALSTDVVPRYGCFKSCSRCTYTSAPVMCSFVIDAYQRLDPRKCAQATGACPVQGMTCGDGFLCCATVCQTCQSCSTSCDSQGSCRRRCTSYTCSCVCVSSTSNNQCSVSCS